jgi:hypothetical protein
VSLQDWARNGWLTEHQSSPQEIADLLALADRDPATQLRDDVHAWLRKNHPDLLRQRR